MSLFAEKQIFIDNFQCVIGLSIRRKRDVLNTVNQKEAGNSFKLPALYAKEKLCG
jgi:hypothetical protein